MKLENSVTLDGVIDIGLTSDKLFLMRVGKSNTFTLLCQLSESLRDKIKSDDVAVGKLVRVSGHLENPTTIRIMVERMEIFDYVRFEGKYTYHFEKCE